MDRIERHDLINAVALAAVLMTLALLLILGARALFRTVDDGLVQSTAEEPAEGDGAGEQPAGGEGGGAGAEGEGEGAAVEGAPAAEVTTTTEAAPTTTTTAAPRPPAEVTVRVGNGAQRAGVAAAGGNRLSSLGYDVVDLANAPPLASSVVYFAEGYEAEGRAVAAALSVGADAVRPVPADPELDASGVAVLVILGADTTVA